MSARAFRTILGAGMSSAFDIIVAGGGIAGLTAGLTGARLGRTGTLVLTGDVLGGLLLSINRIDGYTRISRWRIPGYDLCPMAQEQAASAGAEFAMTEVTSGRAPGRPLADRHRRWRRARRARPHRGHPGTSLKKLGVPGEERLFGKGVSHCAEGCDAPLLKERVEPAVVGGG